ncbi:hypothetical protein AeMF1_001509 [Aphanomyces euteiches]|nr:hypothetical protein AeMF1_001509 [Aphanomyces euteiches]
MKLTRWLGHLAWIPQYDIARDLKFDLIAGVTVAMMIVPQEVSLANIMHVPAQYGLYTAAITPVLYALFGSSRVLSVANGSEVSLMIGAALQAIPSEKERVAVGIFLSLYVGLINLTLGCLRLGIVADFFSRPVMGGFLSGGGVLIMISQFPSWFHISLPTTTYPVQTLVGLCRHIGETNWRSFGVGTASIVLLVVLKYAKTHWIPAPKLEDLFDNADDATTTILPKSSNERPVDVYGSVNANSWGFSLNEQDYSAMDTPAAAEPSAEVSKDNRHWRSVGYFVLRTACDLGPLFVCLMGAIAGYYMGETHIKVTGNVPRGLPPPVLPWYGYTQEIIHSVKFSDVTIHAASIALVAYMTSIALAKRLAVRDQYDVNPNQELVALGLTSTIGAFFQVMPPTGGMSRTAVNMQSARTQLASIVTVALVLVLLGVGTGALYYLPKASLAAIIIVAGFWLIEMEEAKWLFRSKRDEFYVWLGSFVLTIGLGILEGLVASIVCSLLAVLIKTKRPFMSVLGSLDDGRLVPVGSDYPDARGGTDGVLVLRIEGSLYFGNSDYATQYILAQTLLHANIRAIVLDGMYLHDMDATTIQALEALQTQLKERKFAFVLANAQVHLATIVKSSGLDLGFSMPEISLSIHDTIVRLAEVSLQ